MTVERIQHGPITELRMARAPVNALNPALCRALQEGLVAAMDEGHEGIVLSGGATVFSAGLDVPLLVGLGDDRAAVMSAWQAFFTTARMIAESPVPVMAALTGHTPAGGCVLALCCDLRVMARSPNPEKPFRIGLNESQIGLIAPEGIQRLLRRAVGPHRAANLLIGGELVPTDEADDLVAAFARLGEGHAVDDDRSHDATSFLDGGPTLAAATDTSDAGRQTPTPRPMSTARRAATRGQGHALVRGRRLSR